MNRQNSELITALYCRLSIDDGNDNESMSISNQKSLLSDYAEKNGYPNYRFYVDDGYTGRNFNRPAFKRLIEDIEAGNVCRVITKDLSRLGRNYIEAGSYIELYFPRHNVQFIAITDNVDTANQSADFDITPFKNILNDMYSRDVSKKVKTGMMVRSRQGKFCGGTPPFGLMRDPNDHGRLVPDPKTAPIVRSIFDLALENKGAYAIAKEILKMYPDYFEPDKDTKSAWPPRIHNILYNPFYKGAHVVCKAHQTGIRTGRIKKIPRSEWEIIEGAHEGIVTPEEWQKAQDLLASHPKVGNGKKTCPYNNIFAYKLHCATCGKSMSLRYERWKRMDIDRTTGKKREPIDKAFYECHKYIRLGKAYCPSHKLEARDLYNLVLEDIQYQAKRAIESPEEFYTGICEKMLKAQPKETEKITKALNKLKKRNSELDEAYTNLYLDRSKGVIPENRFCMLARKLDEEQLANNEEIEKLNLKLAELNTDAEQIQRYVSEVQKCFEITELTEEIIQALIKDIRVGEIKVIDGKRTQEVTIVYNFVGNISSGATAIDRNGNWKTKDLKLIAC